MTLVNATTYAATATIGPVGIGILVGVITFLGIILTIFLLSQNFRRFCYGMAFLIPLTIIGWISRNTATNAIAGDYSMFRNIGIIIGTIIISTGLGVWIERLKFVKKLEKMIK